MNAAFSSVFASLVTLNFLSAATIYTESPAVSAQFPEPNYPIDSPAFLSTTTPVNPTSYAELLSFLERLNGTSDNLKIHVAGNSQDGRPIHLLEFIKPPTSVQFKRKPTVLIIGQQHGNEPAGGEATLAIASELTKYPAVLENINVMIIPRANPDGAFKNIRGLTNGDDVNRDHLLLQSPEGQTLADVFRKYNPEIVIDCHEFSVENRWRQKFGGIQRIDGMLQYATVANLAPSLLPTMDRVREHILSSFDLLNLTHEWYYTTTTNNSDMVVTMGGVVPDTGRNIAGLRNAISFLLETRGSGIGMAHFKRRVFTHIMAIKAILTYAEIKTDEILETHRKASEEVVASAGKGTLTVLGKHSPGEKNLTFLDPNDGSPLNVTVQWRTALNITKSLERDRPFGYILKASEKRSVTVLERLGVVVNRTCGVFQVEKYMVTSVQVVKKADVTGSVGTIKNSVLNIQTTLVTERRSMNTTDYFVTLEQPLANIVIAALEPESQSSFPANYFLFDNITIGDALPIFRVMERPDRLFPLTGPINEELCSTAETMHITVTHIGMIFLSAALFRSFVTM